MKTIQLDTKHLEIIKKILGELNVSVFVFGSRAKNTAKPLSDLDLCIKDNCNKTIIRRLQDAFEESDLPFKVDVVVWSDISESFQRQIEKDLINLN